MYKAVFFWGKVLLFWWLSLFIFGRSSYVTALVNPELLIAEDKAMHITQPLTNINFILQENQFSSWLRMAENWYSSLEPSSKIWKFPLHHLPNLQILKWATQLQLQNIIWSRLKMVWNQFSRRILSFLTVVFTQKFSKNIYIFFFNKINLINFVRIVTRVVKIV